MTDRVAVQRALLAVADKTGLVDFARSLAAAGVELIASGGTAAAIAGAGIPVTPVADVTGSPEMLGGRVKTLHPAIHGGILADLAQPGHAADLAREGIRPIDLVVVNLYPFEETVAADAPDADIIEQIDIGGVALIRAAAKNHVRVAVVVDPADYAAVADAVSGDGLTADDRLRLARRAFARTAAYDAAISRWLARGDLLPEDLVVPLRRIEMLRYGENPDQDAALYVERGAAPWWASAEILQGKAMSFNNYLDAEAAWELAGRFHDPAAVIVKHTNPCGAALGVDLPEAFRAAWACDPLSAFGGIVATNRTIDPGTAEQIAGVFVEVVVAPGFDPAAVELLSAKKNLRLIQAPAFAGEDLDLKRLEGGFVAQGRAGDTGFGEWKVVTRTAPSDSEHADLRFAWTVAGATKSNAVVVAAGRAAVGVGAGDQSRVGAAERAVARAGERAVGAAAASDAFFPFRDGLDVLADAGVRAVVQPGGSRRDDEVIAAADERGVAMVFTGTRRFRH